MAKGWRREPLVTYLFEHAMGPGLLRHPHTNEVVPPPMLPVGLPIIGGKARPKGTVIPSRFLYWEEFAKRFPLLDEWRKSEVFLVPPDEWHPVLMDAWSSIGIDPPTPRQFARDFMPHTISMRKMESLSQIYRIEDIKYLAAWSHGWPVLYWEIQKAAGALRELGKLPNFFIWAANLDLRPVPLPEKGGTMFQRMALRARLEDQPLDLYGVAMNKATANMSIGMLKGLARKPVWTSRSTRLDYISGKPYAPRKRRDRPNKNTRWYVYKFRPS